MDELLTPQSGAFSKSDLIRLRDLAIAEDNYELFKEVREKLDELSHLYFYEYTDSDTGS